MILKPKPRYCLLVIVAAEVGWRKKDLITTLESRRINENKNWHKKRIVKVQSRRKAVKENSEVQKINKELEAYGF